MRNPFDLYVSKYEFGWWRRAEFRRYYEALPRFRDEYPTFPDLSFADYVKLSNAAHPSEQSGSVHARGKSVSCRPGASRV